MPSLSIIVPTFNRVEILRRCLRALGQQTPSLETFEVIVADDGSSDETRAMLEKEVFPIQLRPLFLPQAGPSAARNRAAEVATGDLLLFLGDDILAAPGLVAAHLQAHDEHPEENEGVLGQLAWSPELATTPFLQFLGEPDCPFQFSFSGFDPENVPLGRMYGSHLSLKRSFFMGQEGFDESFTLPAWDDIELQLRYRRVGFRLRYRSEALAHHYHPYDLPSFCRRMRMVGRATVPFYAKHPDSVLITNLPTLLTLRVREAELDRRMLQLEREEAHLAVLLEDEARLPVRERQYEGWREVLTQAMALGAQEAAREAGWQDLSALLEVRRGRARTAGRRRLRVVFSESSWERGLTVIPVSDTSAGPTRVVGRPCWQVTAAEARGQGHLYLRADATALAGWEGPVRLTIIYADVEPCSWCVEYDSSDEEWLRVPHMPGAFKRTALVENRGERRWKRAVFQLDDWLFLGRCSGADFRITVLGDRGVGVAIRSIVLEPDQPSPDEPPHRREYVTPRRRGATRSPVILHYEAAPESSIIIPVHGLIEYTAACLQAIRESTDGRYEVIVIDNGSPDQTLAYLARCIGVRTIRLPRNEGFAIACNRGAAAARGELLVFLNNDTVPLPGWLAALRATLTNHPDAGIVGAKLLYPRGLIQHAGVEFNAQLASYHRHLGAPSNYPAANQTRAVAAVTGACILLRRAEFLAVGGFDERYRNSFEDVDLCLKMLRQGRSCLYCAESVLYHHTSTTPGRFSNDRENYRLFMETWGRELAGLIAAQG